MSHATGGRVTPKAAALMAEAEQRLIELHVDGALRTVLAVELAGWYLRGVLDERKARLERLKSLIRKEEAK